MSSNPDEIWQFLNRLFLQHKNKPLNDLQKAIVIGICLKKTHQDTADDLGKSHDHIRKEASKLFKEIESIVGKKCTRNTFVLLIEHLLQERDFCGEPPVNLSVLNPPKNIVENPFIPLCGRIDEDQYFFNCQREIRKIFSLLNSGSSVSLVGDRQIGKSSLLKAVARAAEQSLNLTQVPIYLNLQRIKNEEEFYYYLCDEIGIEPCDSYNIEKVLEKNKFLLLIDEIEKMNGNGFSYNVRDKLRSMAEGSETPLRLVVASQLPLDRLFEEDRAEGKTSPLDNICIQVTLRPWDKQTSRKFIDSRLEPTPIEFKGEDIERLIAESGGHPQKLMYLCYEHYEDCCDTVGQ